MHHTIKIQETIIEEHEMPVEYCSICVKNNKAMKDKDEIRPAQIYEGKIESLQTGFYLIGYVVLCNKCKNVAFSQDSYRNAIERWNTLNKQG